MKSVTQEIEFVSLETLQYPKMIWGSKEIWSSNSFKDQLNESIKEILIMIKLRSLRRKYGRILRPTEVIFTLKMVWSAAKVTETSIVGQRMIAPMCHQWPILWHLLPPEISCGHLKFKVNVKGGSEKQGLWFFKEYKLYFSRHIEVEKEIHM